MFKPWIREAPRMALREYGNSVARLDLNESPYPPPGFVVEAAARELGRGNRYPDGALFRRLYEAISAYTGLPVESLVVGAGGDDILRAVFAGTVEPGDKVVAPRFSFGMYRVYAKLAGTVFVGVPVEPRGEWWMLDEERFISESRRARLVLLDRPNNPTGSMFLSEKRVEELLGEAKGLVVVDEAYYEFTGNTVAGLVETHENLVVLRTLSKAFCLAGLRVGYALAHPETAEKLRRLLPPFPTSRPSVAAAIAALKNPDYAREVVGRIAAERERLRETLRRAGARPYASHTNFVLVETGIDGVVEKLYSLGVAVRSVSMGDNWFRATVGLPEENDRLIEAISRLGQRPV